MKLRRCLTVMLFMALCMVITRAAATQSSSEPDDGFWLVQTSVYTKHFSPAPEHNNHQGLLGIERNQASGLVYGAATFRNSFGQRSYYGYAGMRFDFESGSFPLYAKVTGGLLKGYRGEYRDKIPFNRYGIAPVIIPGFGVNLGPVNAEAILLGASAAMLNVGVRF